MEPNAAPAGETGNSLGEEWLDAHPALHSPILHIFNGTEFVTANGFTVDKSTGDLTLLRTLEVNRQGVWTVLHRRLRRLTQVQLFLFQVLDTGG